MSSQIYTDRRVAVRIVGSESHCGRCPQMRVDTLFCTLFGNSTNFESTKGKRLPECIAAEKAFAELEARAALAPRTREQQRMEITPKRSRFMSELARLKRELGRLPTKVELRKTLGVKSILSVYKMGELLVERGMLPAEDFPVSRRNSGRKTQKTPTTREGEVLVLVWHYATASGAKPSLRDIADHGGMAPSNAAGYVKRLREKGYIAKASGRARDITLTTKGRQWAYKHTQGRD